MKIKLPVFSSKALFLSFVCAITTVSLTVFLTGLSIHRSVYQNAIITLSVLALCFLLFLMSGLYYGFYIKHTLKRLSGKIGFVQSDSGPSGPVNIIELPDFPGFDDGLEGFLLGILLWIAIAALTVVLLFFFETIFWASIVIAIGSLHWIFYRALRLVLRHSSHTKGNIIRSMGISFYYTLIYLGWIYAIVFVWNWVS